MLARRASVFAIVVAMFVAMLVIRLFSYYIEMIEKASPR